MDARGKLNDPPETAETDPDPGAGSNFILQPTRTGGDSPGSEGAGRLYRLLAPHYPHLSERRSFIERAREWMAGRDRFAALALRVDRGADTDRAHLQLAATLEDASRSGGALWGLQAGEGFGCLVAGDDAGAARGLVSAVRSQLADADAVTVSAGIAACPTGNFMPAETLENACKALDHAAFLGPDSLVAFDAVSLNISGDRAYQNGDLENAMVDFGRGLEMDPDNVNLLNSLGVCHGERGEYPQAMACFRAAVDRDPDETMAVYNCGLAHLMMGQRREAFDHFLRAGELNPDRFEVALQAGRVFLEHGDVDRARVLLEKAVRLAPDSGAAHRFLGDCYSAGQRVDDAVAAYRSAVRSNPNDAESLSALGCLYDSMGENSDVTTVLCRQSVAIAPRNGLFRKRLAGLYLKQNRLEDALRHYEAADAAGCNSSREIEAVRRQMDERAAGA